MTRDLPESVLHADGRIEPFEPELITRSLFAAAERLGEADAFLARELTEGVLHFLTAEHDGPDIATSAIAEVVFKVVRELGHPELARAFEQRRDAERKLTSPKAAKPEWPGWLRAEESPGDIVQSAAHGPLEAFSLAHVFPPDLVSAHVEGLIRLTGLATPLELGGIALPVPPDCVSRSVHAAREIGGEFLAIDGPEFDLAASVGEPASLADAYIAELADAAAQSGLHVLLNLNSQSPPPRLAEAAGPLFAPGVGEVDRRTRIAEALAERARGSRFTIWWHLAAATQDELAWLPSSSCEFVFDRPRGPVHLAPGIDRQSPSTLIQVGINLSRLVELVGGAPVDPELFLNKVASLARFAKTAGHVKQDFLRKYGRLGIREAFRLDRARLVLVPLGLAEAARASDRPSADFGREILKAIRTAAETDRPRVLPVRVDSPIGDWGSFPVGEPESNLRQHVRVASMLHAACGAGRFEAAAEKRGEILRLAGETNVARIRFSN